MTTPPAGLRIDILFERAYNPDPRVRRVGGALAAAGHDVRVLAWDRTGALPHEERDNGMRIVRSAVTSHDGRGWRQLLYLARAIRDHIPRLRADRPDVLHAVDLPMLVAAVLLAPFLGRPRIVYDAFEIYSVMERLKYPGPLIRVIALVERLLPRFADLVITVGPSRRRWFRERGIDSVIVGNWIDPPAGPPTRDVARAMWDVPPDRFLLLYAGGMDPSRDLEPLLGVAARHTEDLVIIAGRGSQEPRLRELAADVPNVRFAGFVADPTSLTLAADALYYSLRPDDPYAPMAAPNNLYVAVSHAIPLVHRGQGEIGDLAATADIGESFTDDASLDRALDRLRDPGRQAAVRASLAALQRDYTWSRAAAILLAAYPRARGSSRTRNAPSTKGP